MKTILVIRLSAMGDVAMTSPLLYDLRKKNPDVRIVVLTRPFFKPFFRNTPEISFVDVDLNGRHKGLNGLFKLYHEIKNTYKVDYVADLHDVLRSRILRFLFFISGKKIAVIDKGRNEKKKLTHRSDKIIKPLKPTIERYLDVFNKLGFEIGMPELEIPEISVPQKITDIAGEKNISWVGISPFARHPGKIYPLERMEQILGILSQEEGLKLFIFGGGNEEKKTADKWASKYKNVISIIGKIDLEEELDLIANLDVMVSMDSSAMHMASLVGTPVVSIWGATHPYTGFMGYGQTEKNAVQVDMACRPCSVYGNKPCLKRDYPCMNQITSDMIINKILNVISK